jgi:hypothetical protein
VKAKKPNFSQRKAILIRTRRPRSFKTTKFQQRQANALFTQSGASLKFFYLWLLQAILQRTPRPGVVVVDSFVQGFFSKAQP